MPARLETMATAQKRGFRLPWGSDPRRDDPSSGDQADGESTDAIQDASGELGAGPFGLAGTAASRPAKANAQAGRDAGGTAHATDDVEVGEVLKAGRWPASDRRTAGPLSSDTPLASLARAAAASAAAARDREAGAEAPSDTEVAMPSEAQASVAEIEADADREVQEAAGASVARTATYDGTAIGDGTASGDDTAIGDGPEAIDAVADMVSEARIEAMTKVAPGPKPRTAASSPTPGPAAAHRSNPLVAGLVRAMREATATARDEVVASFRVDADGRAEAIRGESAATTEDLKKAAEADVASIKEWSRAELARVREETESRIADRKAQLVEETDFEAGGLQERLTELQATVEAFESDMVAFFERLLAEEDPARLATLAEQMPSPPSIGGPLTDEPEPDATPDPGFDDGRAGGARSRSGRRARADDEVADAEAPTDDRLEPDAAAAAEAEARIGLDVQDQLLVSGLSSVAGIAAFKAALVNVRGVSAVGVTAGVNDDEVVYTVTHDGRVGIREVLQTMDAFEPRVVAEDGATLVVAVREPAA
jgi:hypothetical protein